MSNTVGKFKLNLTWISGESLPLILIVLGGDQFTIEKVASAVQNNTAVVVVNGTGDIANMLAEMVQALNKTRKR